MTVSVGWIDDLWSGFDDNHHDLGRLLIIADAYREEGNDDYADCLQWCYRNGRKPDGRLIGNEFEFQFEWYVVKSIDTIADDTAYIPSCFESTCESLNHDEYYDGHDTPSLAYQFLCRMWHDIGGVKEEQ